MMFNEKQKKAMQDLHEAANLVCEESRILMFRERNNLPELPYQGSPLQQANAVVGQAIYVAASEGVSTCEIDRACWRLYR